MGKVCLAKMFTHKGFGMVSWPEQRKEFLRLCRRAIEMGMQVSTGGNLSMRLQEDLFLVKPSGISLYDLSEQNLLLVTDASGETVEGSGKPTKEIGTHLSIYRARKDVGGVVHYHPPYATAYAVRARPIPLLTVHAERILGMIPVIPPGAEGSEALASLVQKTFSNPSVKVVLLAGHGILAAGTNLVDAQNLAELVEESAKIAYLSERLPTT
jgi:L-ribulose-5-phosphate 4-epimerase